MTRNDGTNIVGGVESAHDFEVFDPRDGKLLGRIWHSDIGEWTVDTVDGPYWTRRNREDAIRSLRPGPRRAVSNQ